MNDFRLSDYLDYRAKAVGPPSLLDFLSEVAPSTPYPLATLPELPPIPEDTRSRAFVSYHHKNDQAWCDSFCYRFGEDYRVFTDRRLDEPVRSDDPEYVNRAIRERHIKGSSITIVLCGEETFRRKYVDWEIHSTLVAGKPLLGILLPTLKRNASGIRIIPDRLYDNWLTQYAHVLEWTYEPHTLRVAIGEAKRRARQNRAGLSNSRLKMPRNLP